VIRHVIAQAGDRTRARRAKTPLRLKTDFLNRIKLIWAVQSPSQKYFCFSEAQSSLCDCHPVPSEGRFAIVTDAGRDAVDADALEDERRVTRTAKTCGPDTPTLVSSLRSNPQATVARKPGRRGEHEISR
jgi:hypothetical protein